MAGGPRRWEVVGGAGRGGIIARAGQDLSSEPLPERLATGAVIEEQAVAGERLHYRKVSGAGPQAGWVSFRTGGRDILVPCGGAPPLRRGVGAAAARARVLCLHGYGANPAVTKLGIGRLKPKLGPDFDIAYLDGPFDCGSTTNRLTPRGAFLDRFKASSGGQWKAWFDYAFDPDDGVRTPSVLLNDPDVRTTFVGVEEAVASLRRQIADRGPADALIGFSQGALLMAMLEGMCRAAGEAPPWRLSVIFCGLKMFDEDYHHLVDPPLACPALLVDDQRMLPVVAPLYANAVSIAHEDGHSFPSTDPRAEEVYAQVAAEMRKRLLP